jgi:predicted heme/steroid binding protein
MARISTYPIISTPTLNDLLIGTDVDNLNNTKNFTISEIGSLIGQDYVPYVGATGNVNLGVYNIEASAFIVDGGLANQFLKANGTLDSTAYVPETRTITINGTTYNLSANRTWDLPTIDSLTTIGTSGAATYIGKVLNIPIYQPQGNYITQLSGEATALGPDNATVTLDNTAVISKVLSGLNITGGNVIASDSILTAFGKVQNQINSLVGGVQYQGTWNADTNTPFLQSSVGVKGYYYVVSVPGNTDLNGITEWKLGDWAIFEGTAWEKVDNTDAVVSVNGYTGAVVLTFSDVGAPPATRTLTINGVGYDLSADRSWTVGDVRTDGSYANPSWITSLGWNKISSTPTTLAGYGITDGALNTTTLTINGTAYDLTANRTWNVGTVTSIGTSGPITGGTITNSGTIGITQSGPTSDGYLSAADWNDFNEKLNALSASAPITLVADVIGITQSGASSNGYLSSTDWNTFNNKQNALTNPVTGTGTTYTLPMWSGATTLTDSPLSYLADVFTFQYNSNSGGTVNFTNSGLTAYTYSIQMNNFGSPRSTIHSYTDGIIVQSIGGTQVSRMFANGNMILGDGFVDNGYKLEIEGNLYLETIANATVDTDKFIVSDAGLIKYRTGTEVLSDIGAVPSTRTLTINGTAYDLSADRSWSVGTVTSVDMSVPSGFAIAGNPVTGAGTLALSFAAGYSLPTNASQTTWDTAYNDSIVSASVTGTATKTLTLNQQDGGTVTASWTDIDTAPVTSVFGRIGDILAQSGDYTTTLVTEGTNLYYTDARARLAISLTTTGSSGVATYNNTTGVLNIPDYESALTGYVPYTGANQTVNLNTQQLLAGYATFTTNGSTDTLTINHTSGSGKGINVTKSGNGEGLTIVKSSGSGNVASITGGVTLISELNLTTSLADAYIASAANWNTAYNNRITSLTTTGTSGAATLVSHVLNIPQYQAQGDYITSLTGEATASGPGAAAVTLTNSAVTGKVLTGLTVTGTTIASTDSILSAFGKIQGQINDLIGGLQYQGTWNASTNTPTITSSVGTEGYFYIVSVAGNTTVNGISDWQVGDWIVFHGTTWQKVDNTESVVSVNGFVGAVTLTTSNISEGTNLYFTDLRARQAISLTTTGNSGASTYNNGTGVLNVPQYTLTGLGGVPTTRSITINGVNFDLSADRTYNVGTVTSIATTGPITGGTITGTGTIGITQSSSSSNGFLSSTDWNTFNGKQNTISLTTTGTSGAATFIANTLNIPNYADGGVLSLSAIGGTANANGATITGTVLNLQPADASFGGVVTTGTQTFAGAKTLTGALSGTSASFAGDVTITGANALRGSYGAGGKTTNFAAGNLALSSNTTGNFNTAIGRSALENNTDRNL